MHIDTFVTVQVATVFGGSSHSNWGLVAQCAWSHGGGGGGTSLPGGLHTPTESGTPADVRPCKQTTQPLGITPLPSIYDRLAPTNG